MISSRLISLLAIAACGGSAKPALQKPVLTPVQQTLDELVHPGRIAGIVSDEKTHEPLFGVTVVVSSAVSSDAINTLTSENGRYAAERVPGTYDVLLFYAGCSVELTDVQVRARRTSDVSWAFDQHSPCREVIKSHWFDPAAATQTQ
jgi:hypothetical protein